jgi:hypothetical protein
MTMKCCTVLQFTGASDHFAHLSCSQFTITPTAMPPRPSLVVLPPAPDSPRSAQSLPPTGIQGDLEQDLMGLANALYNLGTTVVNDSTKDPGTGKQVGLRVCARSRFAPSTIPALNA